MRNQQVITRCQVGLCAAALLLADFSDTLGTNTEAKTMDAFYRACKEVVRAADGLMKALLPPKSRSLPRPGKHVLDAAAATSHDLVQCIYSVLLMNKDEGDQNEPPGMIPVSHNILLSAHWKDESRLRHFRISALRMCFRGQDYVLISVP